MASQEDKKARRDAAWQQQQLPLMRWMLVGLTVFFVLATIYQASIVQRQIVSLGDGLSATVDNIATLSPQDVVRARLEAAAIRLRYQHSGVILMSRAWIIYLGFVTGMILAMVGASFILGRILEPESTFDIAQGENSKWSFKSQSPGLVLATLGTLLMVTTIVTRADVNVTDTPLYVVPAAADAAIEKPANLTNASQPATDVNDEALNAIAAQAAQRSKGKQEGKQP